MVSCDIDQFMKEGSFPINPLHSHYLREQIVDNLIQKHEKAVVSFLFQTCHSLVYIGTIKHLRVLIFYITQQFVRI